MAKIEQTRPRKKLQESINQIYYLKILFPSYITYLAYFLLDTLNIFEILLATYKSTKNH